MLEGSHGQRVEVWLRRNDERTGVSRVTSSHFFFAVAAPNLYVPPVFAIESTIFIQATLSSFCFLSRCGDHRAFGLCNIDQDMARAGCAVSCAHGSKAVGLQLVFQLGLAGHAGQARVWLVVYVLLCHF